MAFCELHLFSSALGVQTTVNVIIPQKTNAGEIGVEKGQNSSDLKCLYLLHGLSDDHTIWMRRTSIERYAAKYGICVVMPFGGKSFYTDMKYGEKYYTFISEELPAKIREFFKVSDKREDNYIAGLSMGGYGALKAALRNTDKYEAVAGLSSVSDIKNMTTRFKNELIPVFGEDLEISDDDDLFKLAEKANKEEIKPRVYMGVGLGDFMYNDTIRLKEKFETLDFDFTFRESEGSHNWDLWDEYIQYVLSWMFDKE